MRLKCVEIARYDWKKFHVKRMQPFIPNANFFVLSYLFAREKEGFWSGIEP